MLKDVLHLTHGEANVMLVLDEDNQVKLKYLLATMAARDRPKYTQCHVVTIFYEGDGNRSDFVAEAFLAY